MTMCIAQDIVLLAYLLAEIFTAGCATLWIFTLKLHRAKSSLLNLVHEAANMTNFESRLKVSTPNVQCTVKEWMIYRPGKLILKASAPAPVLFRMISIKFDYLRE